MAPLLLSPPGALSSSMFIAKTGLGEPIVYHWPEVKINGGAFLPPLARTSLPKVSRLEIYRGKDFTGISGLSVDPEGRFFLIQDCKAGDLYQVDLHGRLDRIVDATGRRFVVCGST